MNFSSIALQTAEIWPFGKIEKLDCFNFLHVGIYPHTYRLDYEIKFVVTLNKLQLKV